LRVGIYGGTFNPPHIGHERAAKAAAIQLGLDLLVIVPVGIPPHKPLPPDTPSADIRLFMTHTEFKNTMNAIVSNIEVSNPGPSYTVETVSVLKQIYPEAELFLLVGTDMYLSLETWKNYKALLEIATPAVFSRNAEDHEKIERFSSLLLERYGVKTETVINNVIPISSSELRDMLRDREGVRYITDTNYSYIIKNRLYNAKPNWDWLRERAHSMLTPLRLPHVVGCEEEALRLAKHWNVDEDEAREAAILHDITKRFGVEANLRILEDHGMSVGKIEYAGEKLLHSQSGALLAKAVFGVSEAVADAIRWHTTGRANMSMLEKVIYIADYIEPTRDFPGVAEMRALAYENLDEALIMGLEMSVSDMKERGIKPDNATFEALDDLRQLTVDS